MIWLIGPALAATVATYVVALATRPPGTCKLRVLLPEGRIAPGSAMPVILEVEAVSGPLTIATLSLRLVQSPGYQELLARYGSLVEPEDRILESLNLAVPGRLEAGAVRTYEEILQLPDTVDANMMPAVEARLWLSDTNLPPVKARRLLKLS